MKVLIIAPHQDDEVLAAGGLIQKCVKLGHAVTVLFVTNGDYHGPQIARLRYFESYAALAKLGLTEHDLCYLGFGDTGGMCHSHSFLRKIFFADFKTPFNTPFSTTTYHPAQKLTVHAMRTGLESPMTHDVFLSDLRWFIKKTKPNLIVIPHPKDMHGDHASIFHFLQKIDEFKEIEICLSYIIHGGNDKFWPIRKTNDFTCPPIIQQAEWNTRVSIRLSKEEQQLKYNAIRCFSTQIENDLDDFLISFSKKNEVFFFLQNNLTTRQNIYNHFEYKETP